jgi:GMP synthase-like glutamine amidotransferase
LIAEAVAGETPYWGVCLGAQLLAASLGAKVAPGALPEVGVLPVQLTADAAGDPVFASAPTAFEAFHWHADTYDLPDGAEARFLALARELFGRWLQDVVGVQAVGKEDLRIP